MAEFKVLEVKAMTCPICKGKGEIPETGATHFIIPRKGADVEFMLKPAICVTDFSDLSK